MFKRLSSLMLIACVFSAAIPTSAVSAPQPTSETPDSPNQQDLPYENSQPSLFIDDDDDFSDDDRKIQDEACGLLPDNSFDCPPCHILIVNMKIQPSSSNPYLYRFLSLRN